MIDENEDCVAKSKLTITVKIFTKCNERSKVPAKQTNKQTNRLRGTEAGEYFGRTITNRHTSRLTHTQKQTKMGPYVLLLLK